jgi:hypothetical protein
MGQPYTESTQPASLHQEQEAALLEVLDAAEEYLHLTEELAACLKEGNFNMARARYSMGPNSVGEAQYSATMEAATKVRPHRDYGLCRFLEERIRLPFLGVCATYCLGLGRWHVVLQVLEGSGLPSNFQLVSMLTNGEGSEPRTQGIASSSVSGTTEATEAVGSSTKMGAEFHSMLLDELAGKFACTGMVRHNHLAD